MSRSIRHLSTACALFLAACTGSDGADDTAPETVTPDDPCEASVLEDDSALNEGASDPATWTEIPADAVVASTYLRLDPDNLDVFGQAAGPVIGELMAGLPGLLHVTTAASESCGVARTLTVWETEDAMMAFVLGDAHSAAIARTAEISRGGSITGNWLASELDSVDFAGVAAAFEGHDGPVY